MTSTTHFSPAGYYVSFVTSPALRQAGETLVKEVEQGNWKQQALLIDIIRLFDQEAGRFLVMDGLAALGISGTAERFVQSILSGITATTNKVAKQVVSKLDEQQMRIAAEQVRSLSLYSSNEQGQLEPRTGFIVPNETEELRLLITREVRAGNWASQRENTTKLLSDIGDRLLSEVYLKSIKSMGLGFFSDKIVQGGASVARVMQHKLVEWAISTLDEPLFHKAVDFMELRTLHLPEPQKHHYFFYPNS